MIVYITHSHTYTEYILYTFITDEYVILILGKENKYHASSCISSWHTPQSLQCYNTKTLLYTRHYSIHTFYNSFPFFLHLFHTLSLSLSTSFLKKKSKWSIAPTWWVYVFLYVSFVRVWKLSMSIKIGLDWNAIYECILSHHCHHWDGDDDMILCRDKCKGIIILLL